MQPSKTERILEMLDELEAMDQVDWHRPIGPGRRVPTPLEAFLRDVRDILAEPDAPTSDAGAEIVAELDGRRLRAWEDCDSEFDRGWAQCLDVQVAKAREIHARHQTRRVVVVELDEDFVAQHPQPTEEA